MPRRPKAGHQRRPGCISVGDIDVGRAPIDDDVADHLHCRRLDLGRRRGGARHPDDRGGAARRRPGEPCGRRSPDPDRTDGDDPSCAVPAVGVVDPHHRGRVRHDQRRLRHGHECCRSRCVLRRTDRPVDGDRLPARLPPRRRALALAVPGRVHRPLGSGGTPRAGPVRTQRRTRTGRRLLHTVPSRHDCGSGVLRRWRRGTTAQPVVLAARRRGLERSAPGVLGRDDQGRLRAGPGRRPRLAPRRHMDRDLRHRNARPAVVRFPHRTPASRRSTAMPFPRTSRTPTCSATASSRTSPARAGSGPDHTRAPACGSPASRSANSTPRRSTAPTSAGRSIRSTRSRSCGGTGRRTRCSRATSAASGCRRRRSTATGAKS